MTLDDFVPSTLPNEDVIVESEILDASIEELTVPVTFSKPESKKIKSKTNLLFPVWNRYIMGKLLLVDEQGDYFLLNTEIKDFPVAYSEVRHNLESPEPLKEKLIELGIENPDQVEKLLWAKYAVGVLGRAEGLTTKRILFLLKESGE